MELSVTVRDLLFASWSVPREDVAVKLPEGLEPELAEGCGLVTLSLAYASRPRLGRFRVPSFGKLTLHTYVRHGEETGLCYLDIRVSYRALAGPALGIPSRTTKVRVGAGLAEVPAVRASFRYRAGGPAEPPVLESGPLGHHELAFFDAGGLVRLHAPHDPINWRAVELLAAPRFDPVIAAGFDVGPPDSLLYANGVRFRAELPPGRA